MATLSIDHRKIGLDYMPYYVCEACNNHGGSLEVAQKMVLAAKEVGADSIKFQLRFGTGYLKKPDYEDVFHFGRHHGITTFFTVFDEEGIELVKALSPPAVKVGSAEWTTFSFVKKVLSLGVPIIVSTGGGHQEHVDYLSNLLLHSTNPHVAILHCTSIYPCPPKYAGLDLIRHYIASYPIVVGFSDHTVGNHHAIGAVALGASIIEKHFTLDKEIGGPDQEFSLYPEDFVNLIELCDQIWFARLPTKKIYLKEEQEKLSKWRDRSVLS